MNYIRVFEAGTWRFYSASKFSHGGWHGGLTEIKFEEIPAGTWVYQCHPAPMNKEWKLANTLQIKEKIDQQEKVTEVLALSGKPFKQLNW